MKRINHNNQLIRIFALFILIIIACPGCSKIERELKVVTGIISDITTSSARAGGNIIDLGDGINDHGHCWSISQDPDISDLKTSLGPKTITGSFTSNLQNLLPGTKYYVRAYARSGDGVVYGDVLSFTTSTNNIFFNPNLNYGTLTDVDGNIYRTIRIGTQNWMAENLKTTRYQNGDEILKGTTNDDWNDANRGLYINYNNDPGNDADYGKLYNWFAVADNRNLCPAGWHVPTKYEWKILENYLVSGVVGGKLKETGLIHWDSPNIGATNESGFTALPGGLRTTYNFTGIRLNGFWWSSTFYPEWPEATGYQLYYDYDDLYEDNAVYIKQGLSVRCIEGPPVISIPFVLTSEVENIASNSAICGGIVNSEGYGTVTGRGVCWSTSEYPTTSNSRTIDGSGSGSFVSNITGLMENTTYYVRAYATNSAGTNYGNQISFTTSGAIVFNPDLTYGEVSDIDGNVYKTIQIGSQLWMAENLKTTRYNDGSSIPLVIYYTDWINLTTSGYCWYDQNETYYKNLYGALYNWHAVNTGKLCPAGWHVPSYAELTTLTTFLGGEGVAGGKLKEAGITHWITPNTGAVNECGFTALPGGWRHYNDGSFSWVNYGGYWWSSSSENATDAWNINLAYDFEHIGITNNNKRYGLSVRCVRD